MINCVLNGQDGVKVLEFLTNCVLGNMVVLMHSQLRFGISRVVFACLECCVGSLCCKLLEGKYFLYSWSDCFRRVYLETLTPFRNCFDLGSQS